MNFFKKSRKILVCFMSVSIAVIASVAFVWADEPIDLGPIVVTASRMAKMDYKISSHVTLIDEDMIAQSNAQSVAGIIKEQLGINIYDKSSSKTSVVDIRGFNDASTMNVLVLINGRKVNSIDLSGADLMQVPLESVKRIEVVRGAASVLYGDNATAGVINIMTKEGRGPLSASMGSYYGSYDKRGTDLELSGSEKGFHYYLYSKYYDDKGYRDNSDLVGKDYDGRFGYRFSDKLKIDLFTSWHEDDYGLPGGLSASELQTLGRKGSADDQDFANTKDRSIHVRTDVSPWPEDLDFGHLVFDASYRNRDTYAEFAAWNFGTKRNIDTYGVNVKYTFDREVMEQDLSFVTGLDYYDTINDILGSGSNTDDISIGKREFGAYIFAEFEPLDNFYVNTGGRYQRADYRFDQRSGTPNYEKKTADESIGMFGLRYEYAKGSSIFANLSQTFRFLATDEWYDTWNGLDTTLDQQKGIQYEVGVKHRLSDASTLSITSYWIEIEDEIFFDPENGFFGRNSNYDSTRRVGVETELRTDLLQWFELDAMSRLEVFAGYTYQEPEFVDGLYDSKRIPMVPRNQAVGGVQLQWWDKYTLSLSGRYFGSRFAINDTFNNTAKVKPHIVLDAQVAYELKDGKAYVAVNNILNEKYYSYVAKSASDSSKDYFPAQERNFIVGMNLKF